MFKSILMACVAALSLATWAPTISAQGAAPAPSGAESLSPAKKLEESLCTGRVFNPITDADWNNIYPITIAGARLSGGGRSNPPLMGMPPVCVCPSLVLGGLPMVGLGVTYWQPSYIAEIEHRPFCFSSIGGVSAGTGSSLLKRSEEADEGSETSQTNFKHVHWYQYPIFSLLEWAKAFVCNAPSGFDLLMITEIDPVWDDDEFAALLAPESVLFANPIAQASCIVDAVAANAYYPLDPLFWCAGSWGGVYPLSGNSGQANATNQKNNLIMAKFMARNARLGLAWQTIGPTAHCFSHINPVWIKSQYRINQVGPIPRRGNSQAIGDLGLLQFPPVANFPATGEHTVNLIWQGQQCCLKPIP